MRIDHVTRDPRWSHGEGGSAKVTEDDVVEPAIRAASAERLSRIVNQARFFKSRKHLGDGWLRQPSGFSDISTRTRPAIEHHREHRPVVERPEERGSSCGRARHGVLTYWKVSC